eukprot:g8279.t1
MVWGKTSAPTPAPLRGCPCGTFAETSGDGPKRGTCVPCPMGRYRPPSDPQHGACHECPHGQIAARTKSCSCTACPDRFAELMEALHPAKGRAQGAAQAQQRQSLDHGPFRFCAQCVPGRFRGGAPGRAGAAAGKGDCGCCPAGKFSDKTGQSSCGECGPGQYTAAEGQAACLGAPCAAGKFNPLKKQTTADKIACGDCPSGKYQDTEGKTDCKGDSCVAGKFGPAGQDSASKATCTKCGAGKYTDQAAQTACKGSTGTSYACTGAGNNAAGAACVKQATQAACDGTCTWVPTGCSMGKYSDQLGMTEDTACKDCLKGKYSDQVGQQACKSCVTGKYQDETGKTECKLPSVPTVEFKTGLGGLVPSEMQKGKPFYTVYVQKLAQGLSAVEGVATKTTVAESDITIKDVKADEQKRRRLGQGGKFVGAARRLAGTGITFTVEVETSSEDTRTVVKGKASDIKSGASVFTGPSGNAQSFQASLKAEFETRSETKTLFTGDKATNFAGFDITVATTAAVNGADKTGTGCKPGKYSSADSAQDAGASGCVNCPSGKYTEQAAQSKCLGAGCKQGHYGPAGGTNQFDASVCYNCPAGQFTDETGLVVCKLCESGKYQPKDGQQSCTGTTCAAGKYGDRGRETQCQVACTGAGKNAAGAACAAQTTKAACDGTCTWGTKSTCSAITDQATCGTKTDGTDGCSWLAACTDCATGQYQDVAGQASCKDCVKGQYQSALGQTACINCAQGTYSDQAKQASCANCAKGKFNDQTAQTAAAACKDCGVGLYQEQAAQAACKNCAKGLFNDQTAQDALADCKKCAKGLYTDQEAQTAVAGCKKCAKGLYNDQEAQTAVAGCKNCAKGLYNDKEAQGAASDCAECAKGKYNDQLAQVAVAGCKNCGKGLYNDQTAQVTAFSLEFNLSPPEHFALEED